MNIESLKEEVEMSLTVAKGSFYKRPEFGHRFKELRNAVGSELTRIKCEAYASEALQWLISYKHAKSIKVNAFYVKSDCIKLNVEVVSYVDEPVTFTRFVEVSDVH